MRALVSLSWSSFVVVGVLAVVPACPSPGEGEGEGEGAGEGEGEGEGEGDEPACVVAAGGRWSVGSNGANDCMGMPMTGTATVDGCALTFGAWNMAMSVPAGASVVGSDVTFTGADWTDCTGTISSDGRTIDAGCSDGCTMTWTASGS